jgi:hypothetical protein
MTEVHYTRIAEGRFTSKKLRDLVSAYEGREVEVSIRPKRNYKADDLRAVYFTRLLPLFTDHLRKEGHEEAFRPMCAQEVHQMVCDMFLREDTFNPDTGTFDSSRASLAHLPRERTVEFLAQFERWLVEFHHIRIPERDAPFGLKA